MLNRVFICCVYGDTIVAEVVDLLCLLVETCKRMRCLYYTKLTYLEMHLLVFFLTMNHQCMVTNHLILNLSPFVLPKRIHRILQPYFLKIRFNITLPAKHPVHISLSLPTNIFMYSASFPLRDS